jgi:hypothetical protein
MGAQAPEPVRVAGRAQERVLGLVQELGLAQGRRVVAAAPGMAASCSWPCLKAGRQLPLRLRCQANRKIP